MVFKRMRRTGTHAPGPGRQHAQPDHTAPAMDYGFENAAMEHRTRVAPEGGEPRLGGLADALPTKPCMAAPVPAQARFNNLSDANSCQEDWIAECNIFRG